MVRKEQVVNSLKELPDQFFIDVLMDKLILLQKVESGLAQSDRGEVYSEQEARKMLKRWTK